MKKFDISAILSITGSALVYLIGGFDEILITLVCFMVLDYITGMIASYKEKTWNSEKGSTGLLKKCTIIILVIMATFLDRSLSSDYIFRSVVICFYIANEGLSILENAGRIGIPIPKRLLDALEQLSNDQDQ